MIRDSPLGHEWSGSHRPTLRSYFGRELCRNDSSKVQRQVGVGGGHNLLTGHRRKSKPPCPKLSNMFCRITTPQVKCNLRGNKPLSRPRALSLKSEKDTHIGASSPRPQRIINSTASLNVLGPVAAVGSDLSHLPCADFSGRGVRAAAAAAACRKVI